jgi:hypothetical protein
MLIAKLSSFFVETPPKNLNLLTPIPENEEIITAKLESLRNKRIMIVAAHPDDELLG